VIKLRDDVGLEDPESRIREYCRVEIYSGYDDKHSVNNDISQEDIQNANNLYAMIDRFDNTESIRLLNNSERISKLLSEIPDLEISDISNKDWPEIKNRVGDLFREFLSLRGYGLAKTTKILHLKRPKLIGVFDSLVVNFLLKTDISGMSKSRQLELGLEALELSREIIGKQKEEFQKLAQQTNDLQIPLSFVRMLDILCWTTEKWVVRGNRHAPRGTVAVSIGSAPLPVNKPAHSVKTRPFNRVSAPSVTLPSQERFVVFEDLDRASGPRVHSVNCFYYKRWLANRTSTTTWHGPYSSFGEAWKVCEKVANRTGLEPLVHSCCRTKIDRSEQVQPSAKP